MSDARPRIGITCDFETITDRRGCPAPRYVLGEAYVEAVRSAGGEPWLLAHLEPERARSVLDLLDGLVISGGDFDIPPAYYGEEARPACGRTRVERSAFERALALGARARNLPLLGVCGGMQLINVAFGGSLYQDVSEREGCLQHSQPHDKRRPHHRVDLTPGSLLARLTGGAALEVNSTHHQIVRALGRDLVATGVAADGVVEGIEVAGARFVVGVQWHPESIEAPEHQAIYRGLVEAARERG